MPNGKYQYQKSANSSRILLKRTGSYGGGKNGILQNREFSKGLVLINPSFETV
jgi:hypothetical protein